MDFNETIARTSDSQLLLNIVRAANRNPTHYSAITQVRDSRNIQGTATAAATAPFGPDATHAYSLAPTLTATGTLAPSFDLAPLDNRAAAQGLFDPIASQIPLTYWQQGWPKTLLLFLFVDDAIVNDAAKAACGLTGPRAQGNDIDNAAYDLEQFEISRKLFECIAPRMQFKPKTSTTSFLKNTNVSPEAVLKALPELDKGDFSVVEGIVGGKKVYSVGKTKKGWNLVLRFEGKGGASTVSVPTQNETPAVLKSTKPAVSFNLRSVDGLVYYLGELIRLEQSIQRPLTYTTPYGQQETLFHVDVGAGADPARNITADFLGERYSVGRRPTDGDRSLTVLTLLSQVFALYREEKDLPKTSAVEVVGAR